MRAVQGALRGRRHLLPDGCGCCHEVAQLNSAEADPVHSCFLPFPVKSVPAGSTAVEQSDAEFMDVCETASASTAGGAAHRSEEHTSELQSLMRISYAVFCLK